MQLAPKHRDGAILVELVEATTSRDALASLANRLDVPRRDDPAPQIKEALRLRDMLIVLDNCEQVVDLGPTVAELLETAPSISMLATSRTPLALSSEIVVRLGGLDIDHTVELFGDTVARIHMPPDAAIATAMHFAHAAASQQARRVITVRAHLPGRCSRNESYRHVLVGARCRGWSSDCVVESVDAGGPSAIIRAHPTSLARR